MGMWYESSIPRVHYIGWHMHKHDFQQGSGGFTSGFRYLIRNLWAWAREADRLRHSSFHSVRTLSTLQVIEHLLERISSSAADTMVLQDGVVVRDVLELASGGLGRWTYLDGQTFPFLPAERRQSAATIYFAWGNGRSARTILGEQFWVGENGREDELRNVFLHPVIEWRGKAVHFAEEIMNSWWQLNQRSEVEDVVRELLGAMQAAEAARLRGSPPCLTSSSACEPAPADPAERLSPRWMATPRWDVDSSRADQSAEAPYRQSNLIGYVDRGGGPSPGAVAHARARPSHRRELSSWKRQRRRRA